MKRILGYTIFLLIGIYQLNAQTVGLIKHDAGTSDDGYLFFAPNNATTSYLIDRCGKQVHSWKSTNKPGQSAYLLPDGMLFRTANVNNTTFVAGGQGGKVEMIDWDGKVTWSYTLSDATKCQHHDARVMPNGNVLLIAWELKTKEEAIAQGRNPSLTSATVWSEQVLEIKPEGTSGGTVVWEWHLWDHLAQDFDSNKTNYTSIASNPQLLNINYAAKATLNDWIHINSIDYNPALDQIMLSSHNTSEVWIIDHSTTTAEAAGHSGGKAGKGGDLIYRWGNPQAYSNGSASDKKFFGQHNAHWIEPGLPYENQIMVFNNGIGRPGGNYSTVEIFNPPVNDSTYTATLPYLPATNSWIFNADNPNNFYSMNISGAQQLSNGNVLTCTGDAGTFYEIDSTGKTLWKYINPVKATGIVSQGTVPTQNMVFRCIYYPKTYSGFAGKTLTAGSIIENSNTVSASCSNTEEPDEPDVPATGQTYKIVGTGQTNSYNNTGVITIPTVGQPFYGQNSNYPGNAPSYTDNGDGTITDNVTGLMWEKTTDKNGDGIINYADKSTQATALSNAANCKTGGYTDWRLPSIKEQYSLIMFYGAEPSPTATSQGSAVPYINTNYFDFGFGDLNSSVHGGTSNERLIDAQYATSTIYVSTTMGGNATMFGVNFADGRIKGYPANNVKKYYVLYVRGNTEYGKNKFTNNGDGTITDTASGLMWLQNDNGTPLLWEDALSYAENFSFAGHSDWRLPDSKELQSLVDYTRSPSTTSSAAIDPLFKSTQITNEAGNPDYGFYWSNTTFCSQTPTSGKSACYVSFGRAMGYMGSWIDVHGAGAQRSDPKTGDPSKYPTGFGPQGDAIRIYNYVRLVRNAGASSTTGLNEIKSDEPLKIYPNPTSDVCNITLNKEYKQTTIEVFNSLGMKVKYYNKSNCSAVSIDLADLPKGIFMLNIEYDGNLATRKVIKI